MKAEFARARQVLRKAVRRASARFRVDLIQSLNYNPRQSPGRPFDLIRKLESISSSHSSGSKKAVMWLKNPLTGALCKTRQENAEAFLGFAEKPYSRSANRIVRMQEPSSVFRVEETSNGPTV